MPPAAPPDARPDPAPRPRRRRLFRALRFGLVLSLLLGLTARQTFRLRRERHAGRGTFGPAYSAEVPPLLAFTTATLGGFRGLFADLLWLRAARMQEQGRFLELVQLAEWITALEPANGEVWAYHAWNLAYNVSLLAPRPEDRWRWVRQGLDLLRVEGVRRSPASAQVRRELAWMFQHKLGTDMDPCANVYRGAWARDVAPYLDPGGAPPAPGSLNDAELPEALSLDPGTMRRIDRRFGALDWRVPCAHAVYWALEALDRAPARERLACRRIVYQSLAQMIHRDGLLEGDPEAPEFVFRATPNERLLDGTLAFLEETLAAHRFRGVRIALAGLLLEGARIDARHNRDDAAREKYVRAAVLFGDPFALPPLQDFLDGTAAVNWDLFPEDEWSE